MPASVSPLFYDRDQIRTARAQILLQGYDTVEDWAVANGFSVSLVQNVLTGTRRCIRGKSKDIALLLGLPTPRRSGIPANDQAPATLAKPSFTETCSDARA